MCLQGRLQTIESKDKDKPPGFNIEDSKINQSQSQAEVDKEEKLIPQKSCVSNLEIHTPPVEVSEISQQV
jgi:hypothetical protein